MWRDYSVLTRSPESLSLAVRDPSLVLDLIIRNVQPIKSVYMCIRFRFNKLRDPLCRCP